MSRAQDGDEKQAVLVCHEPFCFPAHMQRGMKGFLVAFLLLCASQDVNTSSHFKLAGCQKVEHNNAYPLKLREGLKVACR